MEWLIRFLVGGVVVSLFAFIGDVVRPKSFAGIFGAAPSVALATLTLTIHAKGASYAATEARSMIVGAASLMIYAAVCSRIMWKRPASVQTVTLVGLVLWVSVALLLGWVVFLRDKP